MFGKVRQEMAWRQEFSTLVGTLRATGRATKMQQEIYYIILKAPEFLIYAVPRIYSQDIVRYKI